METIGGNQTLPPFFSNIVVLNLCKLIKTKEVSKI